MGLRVEDLEKASWHAKRLGDLEAFGRALDGWPRDVNIEFGSYRAKLSYAVRDLLKAVISGEIWQLRTALELMGVDTSLPAEEAVEAAPGSEEDAG